MEVNIIFRKSFFKDGFQRLHKFLNTTATIEISINMLFWQTLIQSLTECSIHKQLLANYFHNNLRRLMNRTNTLSSYITQHKAIFNNTPISFGASTIYNYNHFPVF